ncbi:efflux transporter periplasmic adaptor subunit [Methylomonas lenta]|uniref:Efflux transporter periplasmic adaptor subunit n=1 Tax=Methylomonas lenta TaxID=980561 RepID=A0A177N1B2_9GAMM|nr:efflux RND transporter periplasmic adaptor subunit [Methylomonas lenta]OAI11444.1 efflux transporter periplasmic adaptor subunit [Methylomonas lenta]
MLSTPIKTLLTSISTLLVLVLMILWMAGAFEQKIEPGINVIVSQYSGPTLTLTPVSIPLFEDVVASVQSGQTTEVAAQIQARIKAIHVKSGDRVKPGQILVTLDDQNLKARSAQASGNLSAINARLQSARTHFNRTQGLYDKQSATLANLEMAKADYESLKAQSASARQALNETQHVMDYGQIKATFAARVIDRYAEPGDIALPGKKLLALYDPASLRFEAYVREAIAVDLQVGQVLQARIDSLNKTLPVTIAEIVPLAESGARSVLIKTRVEQQAGLFPGMFARLRIPQGEEQVLLMPEAYLQQAGQLDVVWVLQDGQIVRRFVRLGQRYPDGRIKISAGLQAGDQIILPTHALSSD